MKNILIVEDSKVINNRIKNELINLEYNCHQAFDFKKAEVFLKKLQYDLIILDLHLPDGEGYELISQVKSLTDTKVIVLTSNTEKQLREELFHYGILDYIIKDKNLSCAIKEIHKTLQHIEEPISEKILVIDDSSFICKQIKMVLTPRNYDVTIAKTAKEGLEKLENDNFDLITLDMELPDMHGSRVLEIIKTNKKFIDIPVLIISGTNDADLIRKVYKMGGSDFIRKPFIIEEFVLKVDLWCDYRKTHLEALGDKDKILSQQSKMATMGELLENIVHQSKQPLSLISTIASGASLEQEFGSLTPQRLTKNLETIVTTTENIAEMMDSFRNFYKEETLKKGFDLIFLIEKSFELMKSKFKNRDIEIIKDFENINMIGYRTELMQVFINILNNAMDEFEKQDMKNKYIFVSIKKENNNIYIVFKDNAGGVSNDIIDNIFDSHFTTKDNGAGIGLFMSMEIVTKHHDGEITIKNKNYTYLDKQHNGAEFTIVIPQI